MFVLIKKIFIAILTGIVNGSDHTKRVLLSNQICEIQPALIILHPNEYCQEFHYHPFAVNLDRCKENRNTLNDSSIKLCVPNKAEDLNIIVFNMITVINEWQTLTKHLSCECKCKFDGTKCRSNQWWNYNKC